MTSALERLMVISEADYQEALSALLCASERMIVVNPNLESLFIRAPFVNGRPPKEDTGYDPVLERKAALVAVRPMIENGVPIDAIMHIPKMGDTFANACADWLDEYRDEPVYRMDVRKMEVETARDLEAQGYGFASIAHSYTEEKDMALFVPYLIDAEGKMVLPNEDGSAVEGSVVNFNPAWKIMIADDVSATGNVAVACIRRLAEKGAQVTACSSYFSKHRQEGFSRVRCLHTQVDGLAPILTTTALAVEDVEPLPQAYVSEHGVITHKVVIARRITDVANSEYWRQRCAA